LRIGVQPGLRSETLQKERREGRRKGGKVGREGGRKEGRKEGRETPQVYCFRIVILFVNLHLI
jgi:hypothetical protein